MFLFFLNKLTITKMAQMYHRGTYGWVAFGVAFQQGYTKDSWSRNFVKKVMERQMPNLELDSHGDLILAKYLFNTEKMSNAKSQKSLPRRKPLESEK